MLHGLNSLAKDVVVIQDGEQNCSNTHITVQAVTSESGRKYVIAQQAMKYMDDCQDKNTCGAVHTADRGIRDADGCAVRHAGGLTCDSVEEGRENWAGDSRLGPCRGGLVILEPVLEGGVDAENACQPVRTITRLIQGSCYGSQTNTIAPVTGMCSLKMYCSHSATPAQTITV